MTIKDIGIPVASVNWVRLHAGRNASSDPRIYASMGQNGDNLFVLQIDPETGAFHQYMSNVPQSNYPTATMMSRNGRLYIGGAYAGHLFCFDPDEDALLDLGLIHKDAATFPCRIDEDEEGKVWIGSYGTADLTCFDPKAGTFRHCGRMDDTDMYNYPFVNADGMIVNFIKMTRPQAVVFDPVTETKQTVGPVVAKGEGELNVVKGTDGWVYIVSSEGDFRIEGMHAVAVDFVPEDDSIFGLPDGSTFGFADAAQQINRILSVKNAEGKVHTFELDYNASGNDIYVLHKGPDNCVYGSSILPEHLFRYKPTDGELIDLGKCSESTGEAYSMGYLDDKMYIASYPAARLSVYDPSQGYCYGDDAGANPRELGRVDDVSYRPRSTLTGPLGRVWTASIPDYGLWGGPLSYYDPETEQMGSYGAIFGEGSCYTLAHLEAQKLIAVGTSISGGSGTQPKVDQAALILWDYEKEAKVWEDTLERSVSVFNSLAVAPDGRLIGSVNGAEGSGLFVFDAEARAFTDWIDLPQGRPLDHGLQVAPDGCVYGFTSKCFYRVDLDGMKTDLVFETEASVAGPIVGQDVYFGRGCELKSAEIF